jgi:hypothetical protein
MYLNQFLDDIQEYLGILGPILPDNVNDIVTTGGLVIDIQQDPNSSNWKVAIAHTAGTVLGTTVTWGGEATTFRRAFKEG